MIQLLTGENSYEIRAVRARVIAEFRDSHGADAVKILDGTTVARDELPQLLQGVSLFAPEQLIVLDDASTQKDVWEVLETYLSGSSDVVLVAPTADKRTRTYKWLQKNAEIITSSSLNEAQLVNWLQNEARSRGIDISPDIARFIIEFSGSDQWQLAGDLDKLKLSGRPVTRELVREVLIANPVSSAFELLDAMLNKKPAQVDHLLEGVRASEDPYRFFGLLSNQIFALIVVASAGSRSPDMVAKDTGLHPFVVRKTAPLARTLGSRERSRLAEVAATTDMQLKSSGADPWVLITAALKSIAAQ